MQNGIAIHKMALLYTKCVDYRLPWNRSRCHLIIKIVKLCTRGVWKLIISYGYEVAVSSNMWTLKSYELHRDSQWKCETHLHKQPWFDNIHSVVTAMQHLACITNFKLSIFFGSTTPEGRSSDHHGFAACSNSDSPKSQMYLCMLCA